MSTPILDTIAKLQALAQNAAATPGEVEAALGRIAHLQRLHGFTDEHWRRIVSPPLIRGGAVTPPLVKGGVPSTESIRYDLHAACAAADGVYFAAYYRHLTAHPGDHLRADEVGEEARIPSPEHRAHVAVSVRFRAAAAAETAAMKNLRQS